MFSYFLNTLNEHFNTHIEHLFNHIEYIPAIHRIYENLMRYYKLAIPLTLLFIQ